MMKEHPAVLSALRSDFEIGTILDVQVDNFPGITSLPGSAFSLDAADLESKKTRGQLIEAVRGGKHLALAVTATTWRQRPTPNRRGLRLAPAKLADRVSSWKGKPFLVDHNTYKVMEASKGTILSSKLIEESPKVHSFEQTLEVVKPDAVIGILDRTLSSFSISWFALGPVMCSVHGVDLASPDSCGCWPLETVMVDGKPQIVQYEFTDYGGKETSGVVVGAVQDTSVDEVRAALSAELHLHPPRPRPPKENKSMAFTRLAAALKLAALSESEEDAAVTAVTTLQTRAVTAEAELGLQRAEVARLSTENARLTKEVEAAGAAALDGLIEGAYKSGKLAYGKDAEGKNTPDPNEELLRDLGKLKGGSALSAHIGKMRAVVPVGVPPVVEKTTEPARPTTLSAVPTDQQIRDAATQLGVDENTMRARWGLAPIAQAGGAA
jgi:hypothetical protein